MNLNLKKEFIPFVEKHRPAHFDDIVLDPLNKKILKNIIEKSYFPNLLFYGPPGTGKTTTIINIVNAYQEKLNKCNKALMIHLNASDERGIDVIRNQISSFVNSKPLFHTGMKFVILDEVDYMTKNAQQALRYLLQSSCNNNVRFCLICNYISKIDEGLQSEFMKLRFNQLPEEEIVKFLKNVSQIEKLKITDYSLECVQKLYKSDIRSMLNFIQTNQDVLDDTDFCIIDNIVWETLYNKISARENLTSMVEFVRTVSEDYNVDKKNIIKDFFNYLIRVRTGVITQSFLSLIENIIHLEVQEYKNSYYINYALSSLVKHIPSS